MTTKSPRLRPVLAVGAAVVLLGFAGMLLYYVSSPTPLPEPPGPSSIRFADVTVEAGVDDYFGQTFGAAWGDVDGDGYPDLWASGHSPQRLFVNRRDGTFEDVARESVSPILYSDRHNAAWADFDNDGDDDLIQLSGAGRGESQDPNALYVNDGARLQDNAGALGVTYGKARARAALWLDVEPDGRLDLIMTAAERAEAPPSLFRWEGHGRGFRRAALDFLAASETAQLARLSPGNRLHLITGPPYALFVHRVRGGELEAVGGLLGLEELPGHAVGDLLIADFDNDAAADIVYVRGFVTSAYRQPQPERLEARLQASHGRPTRIAFSGPDRLSVQPYPRGKHWWAGDKLLIGAEARSADALPVELDAAAPQVAGLSDAPSGLLLGFEPDSGRWLIEMRSTEWDTVNLEIQGDRPIKGVTAVGFEPAMRPLSQMIQWNGPAGFEPPDGELLGDDNCPAGAAGDFDNDMDLDIYLVCTGYLTNRANLLLENIGDRRFRPVPDAGGAAGSRVGLGESVAVADYDLDGFLDLFVRNGHELPPFGKGADQLFRNLGNDNGWLALDLEGVESNRNGIGARVTLTAGGVEQVRVADNGVHGRVQDFRRLHFGLGAESVADSVRVEWPSGKITAHRSVPANRVWVLREDGRIRPRF